MDTDIMSEGFLASHPDLRWRIEGARSYESKQYDRALTEFQRSAHHADKPSQAIIAEMYWSGTGVAMDRALAYAWMDLAAERGYATFLGQRERYWNALDEAARVHRQQAGVRFSFDILGEGARTEADALRYLRAYEEALERIAAAQREAHTPMQADGLSIKLSALHPRYEEAQR